MEGARTDIRLGFVARSTSAVAGIVAAVCLFLLFSIGIDRIPVTDRDEARFAQASKQMAVSGDLVDIRFQDSTRYKKPVGIYWAQTAASHALDAVGSNEIWVYRIPSVIAATLACVALYWAGLPLVGSAAAAIAALMLATTFLLQAEARLAKTDAALLLTVILAMGALARAWLGQERGFWTAGIFWTALAAGLLIKGPVVFGPVLSAVLWIALVQRKISWLKGLRPLHGLAWMLALALPWYIAIIWKSEGAFLVDSIGRDFTAKIASAQESHGAPPGAYLLTIWFTAWPWCVLIPAAVIAAFKARHTPRVAFLIGWIVLMWVLLEFVPTKLVHYPLPVFPAVMLLSASALLCGLPRIALHIGVAFWIIAGIALSAVALVVPIYLGDGINYFASLLVLAALATGVFGLRWLYREDHLRGVTSLTASGAFMAVGTFAVALPSFEDLYISEKLAAATACHAGEVHLADFHEPSAVFRMGTDVHLVNRDEALAALASDAAAIAWIEVDAPLTAQTITGLNYSNGDMITLQLYIAPGTPAEEPLCGDKTS